MSDTEQAAEPTRDDLIAAAEAAGAEATPSATPAPAAAPAETATATEEEPRWQRIVREREKGHAERQEAQSYAQQQRAAAEAERDRIIAEAKERARQEAAEELAAARSKFSADPIAHLRSLGTPEEIQDAVMRAGTPEARAYQKLQEELATLKQKASSVDDIKKQLADQKAANEKAAHEAAISQIRTAFLSAANNERAPYLNARYDADDLFWKAESIAKEWRNAGQSFAHDDIISYMEHEAKKRFEALQTSPQPQVNGAAPVSGIAPKVPANGPRNISPAASSERRSTPKPHEDMTPEERRLDLVRVAEEAMQGLDHRR